MRRGLTVAVLAGVMLVACAAQADMYTSLRFAGKQNIKEFAFGMTSGSLGGEVALGYDRYTITDLDNLDPSLEDVEPSLSVLTFGATLFMQIMSDPNYGFDVGGRFQYMTTTGEVTIPGTPDDLELKATLSGWAAGPLLRGYWYLADESITIGPEIYLKYDAYSTKFEASGAIDDEEDGPSASHLGLEYSLRMDFWF